MCLRVTKGTPKPLTYMVYILVILSYYVFNTIIVLIKTPIFKSSLFELNSMKVINFLNFYEKSG